MGGNLNRISKRKWRKGTRQKWKKIPVKGRQGNGCQRSICCSRGKNWNKKNEWRKHKKRKERERRNMNQNKKERGKGWGQRTKNWRCIQHQREEWRARNKRKARKRCTKGGCVKRKQWQKKSKSIKKT